ADRRIICSAKGSTSSELLSSPNRIRKGGSVGSSLVTHVVVPAGGLGKFTIAPRKISCARHPTEMTRAALIGVAPSCGAKTSGFLCPLPSRYQHAQPFPRRSRLPQLSPCLSGKCKGADGGVNASIFLHLWIGSGVANHVVRAGSQSGVRLVFRALETSR